MSENVLKVGDLIHDNDPRERGRIRRIHAFTEDGKKVVLHYPSANMGRTSETRISVSRIFLDDKERKSGWSLVPNHEGLT